VIAFALVALALAPWSHPLAFDELPGWDTGRSGNRRSAYVGNGQRAGTTWESAAWIARGVRYRDEATADPPNRTLRNLPHEAVIVWAVIYNPVASGQKRIRLVLKNAKRFSCCEAAHVAGGEWELTGSGRGHAYSAIVRIYFGSRPSRAMQREGQRALDALQLPTAR
jgi:hypothetical protein